MQPVKMMMGCGGQSRFDEYNAIPEKINTLKHSKSLINLFIFTYSLWNDTACLRSIFL